MAIGLVYEWLVAAAKGLTTMERRAIRRALVSDLARAAEQAASLGRQFDDMVEATELTNTDDEHDPEGSPLSQQWSHGRALLVSLRERLAENAAATTRLETDTYGACLQCGQPISSERLAARPSARLCIGCASVSR